MNISGSCMCGTVSYSGSAEPVIQGNCHCKHCQKTTGSGYAALMFFPEGAVKIDGDIKYFKRVGDSGKEIANGFCPRCGTQLVTRPGSMPGVIAVRVGTLDHPEVYKPAVDIFTRSAAPWDHMDPSVPKFAEYPPLG